MVVLLIMGEEMDNITEEIKKTISRGFFDQAVDKLIEERLYGVAYQKTKDTTEYQDRMKEEISLACMIKETLGVEQELFKRYEELSASSESSFLQNAYRQGFGDGIKFLLDILYRRKK